VPPQPVGWRRSDAEDKRSRLLSVREESALVWRRVQPHSPLKTTHALAGRRRLGGGGQAQYWLGRVRGRACRAAAAADLRKRRHARPGPRAALVGAWGGRIRRSTGTAHSPESGGLCPLHLAVACSTACAAHSLALLRL
jgi:hypothetical protein